MPVWNIFRRGNETVFHKKYTKQQFKRIKMKRKQFVSERMRIFQKPGRKEWFPRIHICLRFRDKIWSLQAENPLKQAFHVCEDFLFFCNVFLIEKQKGSSGNESQADPGKNETIFMNTKKEGFQSFRYFSRFSVFLKCILATLYNSG